MARNPASYVSGLTLDMTRMGERTRGLINQVPLDPKTMKNEGFKPPIYGL